MENNQEILTVEAAKERGFIMDKKQALEATEWSNSTLGRKMQSGAVRFVLVQGKTKPTPMFDNSVLVEAGIIPGDFVEAIAPQTDLAKTPQKSPEKRISQENPKNISRKSQPGLSDFEQVFIIPHKIYLNLDEAKLLTGFPKSELHKFSEMKFGRRVIKRSKLEKI